MQYSTSTCGLCNFEFNHGAHVCQGCQGEIVYGATQKEESNGLKFGGLIGWGLGALVIYGIPSLLNEKLGTEIPKGFGLGTYGFVATLVIAVIGALCGMHLVSKSKARSVRTFRVRYVR